MAALQEAGLWRYAATLTAHTLKGDERAAALERWAAHVHQVSERSPFHAPSQLGLSSAGVARQLCSMVDSTPESALYQLYLRPHILYRSPAPDRLVCCTASCMWNLSRPPALHGTKASLDTP